MRYALMVVALLSLLLAACGGSSTPTETGPTIAPVVPTAEDATPDPDIDPALLGAELAFEDVVAQALNTPEPFVMPSSTPDPDGGLEVPLPGTLVASETEEVEPRGDFRYLRFEQRSQGADSGLQLVIYGDGRVERDGREGRISPADIQRINDAIGELNFFGLQGTFMGPPGNDETFVYRISIETDTMGRAINAQDGYIPTQLRTFMGMVRLLGEQAVQGG